MKTTLTLTRGSLYRSLAACSHAMSKDQTRPQLNGACILLSEGADKTARFAATNGHWLMVAKPTGVTVDSENSGQAAFLDAATVKTLIKTLRPTKKTAREPAEVAIDGATVTVSCSGMVQTFKVADYRFPPIDSVIPSRDRQVGDEVGVSAAYLSDACKAMATFANGHGSTYGMVWNQGDSLDPIRLDWSHQTEGSAVAVIMPMRMG